MLSLALCQKHMLNPMLTFSLTPTQTFDLDVDKVTKIAKEKGFRIENQGELGLSLRTDSQSVSFLKRGSAVVVGTNVEWESVSLYNELLGVKAVPKSQ